MRGASRNHSAEYGLAAYSALRGLRYIATIDEKNVVCPLFLPRTKNFSSRSGKDVPDVHRCPNAAPVCRATTLSLRFCPTYDWLVQAIGQSVEVAAFQNIPGVEIKDGVIQVDESMQTGAEGIFAGGDMVPSIRTITTSIGHGKLAARNINAYLHGTQYKHPPKNELAKFEFLEPWYYSDAPRSHRPRLDVVRRTSGFAEIVGNLDAETAAYEARRCMSCGNCFECDNCYGVCPDNAVTKLGPGKGFEFKYDYCKGCGLCESECPCGAIKMVPEEI